MHGAEAIERLLGERLHRGVVGHVGDHTDRLDALVRQRSGCLVEGGIREDVGQHHLHAFLAEPSAHRAADPARTPGHDGDVAS